MKTWCYRDPVRFYKLTLTDLVCCSQTNVNKNNSARPVYSLIEDAWADRRGLLWSNGVNTSLLACFLCLSAFEGQSHSFQSSPHCPSLFICVTVTFNNFLLLSSSRFFCASMHLKAPCLQDVYHYQWSTWKSWLSFSLYSKRILTLSLSLSCEIRGLGVGWRTCPSHRVRSECLKSSLDLFGFLNCNL